MKLFGHEFGKPKGENSPEGAAVDGGMGANPSQMAELEKVRAANAAESAANQQARMQALEEASGENPVVPPSQPDLEARVAEIRTGETPAVRPEAAPAPETASTAQAASQEAAPAPGPENTPPPAA